MATLDKLYASNDGAGPSASLVRKRVLAAGNGALRHVPAPRPPAPVLVQVPVQEAFPGRCCQHCPTGPEQQLATHVRKSGSGGYDYYCMVHAPTGATARVEVKAVLQEHHA